MKKRIALLGSTGSIGRQTLDVVREQKDIFEIEVLSAQNQAELLIKQALEFKPNTVVIGNPDLYSFVADALQKHDIKVFAGESSITDIVELESIDIVLSAIMGSAGLKPTLRALEYKKALAIANKETLVVAGALVQEAAIKNRCPILPVDSEHSAIFQCLNGERDSEVEKLILTGSGGPFRTFKKEQLRNIGKEAALKHPIWSMGNKITIDSATLMNKGLELIEAHWLFGTAIQDIEVLIHPQSIIHSMVQFKDGSVKAQLGLPDMKLPILYALAYPKRQENNYPRIDFSALEKLSFEKPDTENFRNLSLAYRSIEQGGNMPCILNAANEIAVQAFLSEEIGFLEMSDLIEHCMQKMPFINTPSLNELLECDKETRILSRNIILNKQTKI